MKLFDVTTLKNILLLLLPLHFLLSNGQLRVTEHLLINDGLANNYITDIIQDESGRMWIGTESGLYCYDGYEFHCFNTFNSNLNSNMVNTLWLDRKSGKLWIGTKGNGVCVMDVATCQIKYIGGECKYANNIMNIVGLHNGDMWMVSQTSIMCWMGDSLRVVNSDNEQGFFRSMINVNDDVLLLGHYLGGVSQLDTKTGKMSRLTHAASLINTETVYDFVKDNHNRIWMATDSGLWYYTPETETLEKFTPLNVSNIKGIELIDGGEIWASTSNGLWKVDLSDWSAHSISDSAEDGVLSPAIRKIFQDSFGNIWLGSMGNGIDFLSHEAPMFFRLCKQSVWGIYRDGDEVWVGTADGLLCFRDSVKVREIALHVEGVDKGTTLSVNSDDQGHLMVSYSDHLLQVDKHSGAYREILLDGEKPVPSLTFYKDRDSTLWITACDGIYSMRHGKVIRDEKLNSTLARQSIHGIRRDRQGKLWVGTYENGIYLFDSQKRLVRHLDRKSGLLSNSIQHLHVDPNEGIWMSTPDGMGYIHDTSHPEKCETFGYQQGLNESYICAIQEDAKGNTWVSTSNGISLLRKSDQTFVNFNKYDGIPTNNFTGGAVECNGKLYFTSLDGLCYFDPGNLIAYREMSDIQIFNVTNLGSTQFKGDHSASIVMPDDDGVFHFPYNQNSFRIVFGLKDYAQSRQAEYQYRIKDKDDEWTPLSETAITFRHLSSGHYTIVIRARLKGQPWSQAKEIEARVHVCPPFWQSWWAYLIYIICIAVLGWGLFRRYKHRFELKNALELERQKNLDEQERNTERLQFFTNITHELRTPLTLILGPLEELMQDTSLPAKTKDRISIIHRSSYQLKKLITQLLEFRKTETHNRQLVVMRQDLAQTVRKIGRNFSELNTNSQLRYIINVGDQPVEMYYDENVVTTILNNLMSNAVKYTPKGEIELSLTSHDDNAVVKVRDTGYGISQEALPRIFDRYYQAKGAHQASGTGIGLALVKSLCVLHEADIDVHSVEDHGATFTLTFKKSNTYPNALHKENSEGNKQGEQLTEEHVETNDQRPVVLVVEDNLEIRHYIADSLSEDYQVVKANDGKVGCEKAFEYIPDLIITDIMMPVMDGTEMCKRLKQDVRTSHIPVIMLTAKDTHSDQQEGYDAGADSYLTKPFSFSMLRSRMANLLAARKRLAAHLDYIKDMKPVQEQDSETYKLSLIDRRFLDEVTAYIKENASDVNLTMAMVGKHVNMSHSTLYRKIKALTGLSGNEYIRKVRLHHCLYLMTECHHNVSEAAYESGFGNISYFRNCFKEEFGTTPTEYIKNL
jgi:signal transduction histidine kinase/ligand-binding sensor domain-containing protein/DNA-binding response OmpR family regulator